MSTPINAEFIASEFTPTGAPGEYQVTGLYNNQADMTGAGAYDVLVGFALYVPATSLFTAMVIPGVFHRYRFTSVNPIDPATLSGTVVWDEDGEEEDVPTPGMSCLVAEVTPNKKLALLPSDTMYPSMLAGSTHGALRVDVKNIHDKASTGGAGGGTQSFTFPESVQWAVVHNKGTRNFIESLRDADGRRLYAEVEIVDDNSFIVHFTEATAGTVTVAF